MSSEWGGLIEDWTHLAESSDADQVQSSLAHEPGRWQEELEYSVYADSSMTLPGQGEVGPKCGIWGPSEFCDSCAEVSYAPSHCGRRDCPNCASVWSKRRATDGSIRIQGGRLAESDGIGRRTVHAVVSPPEKTMRTLQQVYDGYRDAYSLAKEKGIRGGVAIFHGYRVKQSVKDDFEIEDPDMGVWKWLLEERPENWRDLTYWSPHYHVIGLCRDMGENKPDEQDGWVIERIDRSGGRSAFEPVSGPRDTDSHEEVIRTFRYLLSHATFESGTSRDCIRWFGSMATTQFNPESELSDGVYNVLERKVKETVGDGDEEEIDGEGGEPESCECCGAKSFSPIWSAGAALADPSWCDEIGREKERRLNAAFEWAIGERLPPPGMRNPLSEEQAEEALQELV